MTSKRFKYLLASVLAVTGWLAFRGCKNPVPVLDMSKPLSQEDVLHVGIMDRVITVRTKTETESLYVPDKGSAKVSIDDKGNVTLDVKNKGFTLVPAVGLLVTSHIDGALGLQLGYWNRLELYGGLTAPRLSGFAGAGYRLDQLRLRNTSIYVAYTTRKEIGVGVMVQF